MRIILHLSLLFAAVAFSGCAIKPWGDPLAEQELHEAKKQVFHIIEEQNICGETIVADLSFLVKTPFNKNALAGFLQWNLPSNYKFIVTNPFGQPILIILGNQKFFKSINTLSRTYRQGSISSFGIRNKISPYFLEGNWQEWLTGSKSLKENSLIEIRNSSDLKGIWVSFKDNTRGGLEHILIDRDKQKITRRLLEDPDGVTKADIFYDSWTDLRSCTQPSEIFVKGLDMGVEMSLKLSNISVSDEQINRNIPIPYGYSKTYLP